MRVPDYLAEQQVRHETLVHPPAFSAQMLAKHLHVSGRQVAKGVLLIGPAGPVIAILPATCHVDTERLERELGGPVRLADEAEVARTFRDCEWGVVPPFGKLYGLPTLLEESLDPEAMLVFECNTHVEAVRLRCADFERLEKPRRLRFARADGRQAANG